MNVTSSAREDLGGKGGSSSSHRRLVSEYLEQWEEQEPSKGERGETLTGKVPRIGILPLAPSGSYKSIRH